MSYHCTEVRFASFLSSGFTSMTEINSPEKELAKCTSVQCTGQMHRKLAKAGWASSKGHNLLPLVVNYVLCT